MSHSSPDDPPLPEYPGHTGAFGRIVRGVTDIRGSGPSMEAGRVQGTVREYDVIANDLTKVTNAELLVLSHLPVRRLRVSIPVEIARRNIEAVSASTAAVRDLNASVVTLGTVTESASAKTTAALVAFKDQSATASNRLESLTRWLVGFTIAVVALTVIVAVLTGFIVWHDLTR